jgi:thiol-disulfide isomerase/thioredoxin
MIDRSRPRAALAAAAILIVAAVGCIIAMPHLAAAPQVAPVDAPLLRKKLSQLRGKVVVLNMWATWCGPCVDEFPDLVKLDRAYRSRGVAVIGLSMDDAQQAPKVVPPFLAKQGATFPVYRLKPGDPMAVVGVFDRYWNGSIPVTYVFDRNGRLKTRLVGARTLDGFKLAIQPLLARVKAVGSRQFRSVRQEDRQLPTAYCPLPSRARISAASASERPSLPSLRRMVMASSQKRTASERSPVCRRNSPSSRQICARCGSRPASAQIRSASSNCSRASVTCL